MGNDKDHGQQMVGFNIEGDIVSDPIINFICHYLQCRYEGISMIAKPNVRARKEPMRIGKNHRFGDSALRFRHQVGFGLLGWLLMIPVGIVVLLLLAFGFYEGRKAYWDSKVREMCTKDGGVAVYEKITIAREQYEKLPKSGGSVSIGSETNSKSEEPVFAAWTEVVLREWGPRVIRLVKLVKRRSDGKAIGSLVSYSRIGGDFPLSYAHPSSFGCPKLEQYYSDQANFFAVKETGK